MTTNTGARESQSKLIGFEQAPFADKSLKAIERVFSPEFRNRLSAIIPFNPLDQVIVEQIVDKEIIQLETRLKEKNIFLSLDSAAKQYLAKKGYDPQMGARPVKRLIEEEVAKPLSEEILFGKLEEGGTVKIIFRDGDEKLSLDIAPHKTSLAKNPAENVTA